MGSGGYDMDMNVLDVLIRQNNPAGDKMYTLVEGRDLGKNWRLIPPHNNSFVRNHDKYIILNEKGDVMVAMPPGELVLDVVRMIRYLLER